jgi:hypothetical protein
MNRRKALFWGVSIVVALAVVVSIFIRSFSSGGTAVDNTGASAQTPVPTNTPTEEPIAPPPPTVGGSHVPFILLSPGEVQQGQQITLVGSNFDPKATIEFFVKQRESDRGKLIGSVQADRTGSFENVTLALPASQPFGNFIIQARQVRSAKTAESTGIIANGGAATVKLNAIVGKVGDVVKVTAKGFAPGEKINVYWNSMGTDPVAVLTADQGGGIGQAPIQVPFGMPGDNSFIFMGQESQTPVSLQFYLLKLYPVVKPSSYSIRADNLLSFSGKGFGPNELVLAYVNKPVGQPLATIQTNAFGSFTNAAGFVVPFSLKGKQVLVFLGSQSRASFTVAFTVAPYMPSVQPSTYGGSPGTTLSFYATGFARNEIVHVYTGNPGTLVSCFSTDGKGNAGAAGSYTIPGNAQVGKMVFTLRGSKSGAVTTATVQVSAPITPVQVPPSPPFTCPLDGVH